MVEMAYRKLFYALMTVTLLPESKGLELPNSCIGQQFYDAGSLTCQSCYSNNSMIRSLDGFSCKCEEHSVPAGFNRCKPCNATELVSSDGMACVPRKCQNLSGKFACRKCPNDYISVTVNHDGSPMKEVTCVKCARGFKARNDKCVRCDSCACNRSQVVVRDACVPKIFVNSRPKYEEKILHPLELLDVVKYEYRCTQNELSSCRTLASLCVKNFYPSDPGGPCRLWIQTKINAPKELSHLAVNPTVDKNSGEINLSRKNKSSILIAVAIFTSKGEMKILDKVEEYKYACQLPINIQVGVDNYCESRVNITNLLSSDMNDTLSAYVFADGEYKQLPVTIRKPNGYDVRRGTWPSSKFQRYFIVHNTLSTVSNATNTIYLRTLLIRIRMERDDHKKGSLKIIGNVEAIYAVKLSYEESVVMSLKVEHEMPSAGVIKGIEIWGSVLGTVLFLYALVQWRGVLRRGGLHVSIVPLVAGSIADALYFATLCSTLHALAAEAGTLGMTLPLSRSEENMIRAFLFSAVSLKALKVAWINWKQCTCDVFFLDWSQYNPIVKDSISENENWKATVLANEWSLMQTMRRAHPGFTISLALICIHLILPWKSLPHNAGYKWALISIAWWLSYGVVLSATWLKERFIHSSTEGLSRLCTNVGFSLLVFQEECYAHYVHGRNDDSKEIRSMAGPLSACRLACVPQVRTVYNQLSTTAPGMLGETELRRALLSRFLAAFFERALDGLNWVASERTIFEKLLNVELTSRDAGNTSALLYDDDSTPSCFDMTWWGEEWNLSTFDVMLFSAVFIASSDVILAAFVCIFVWQVTKQMRFYLGNMNQSRKTGYEVYFN